MADDVNRGARANVPESGQLTLDHVAHFVPEIDAAADTLQQLGFTLTPFSAQSHRLQPGGPLVPAGTGNRCVMFERGYLEFLTPTGATPIADQLRAAIAHYVGVHLVAFGTAAPDVDHERLVKEGFAPLAPVALQREIGTEHGASATARFTVVRVAPGTMAEGRIQFCQQHTPELLWQSRWLAHRNGVRALRGVVMCVADVKEAWERYARYTGISPHAEKEAWHIATAHGDVVCTSAEHLRARWHIDVPALPWIGGAILTTPTIEATAALATAAGCSMKRMGQRLLVMLPESTGGFFVFEPPESGVLGFER